MKELGNIIFPLGKIEFLNTLGILCIPQNFWPKKGSEYQLFDVLPEQTTCKMKVLQV